MSLTLQILWCWRCLLVSWFSVCGGRPFRKTSISKNMCIVIHNSSKIYSYELETNIILWLKYFIQNFLVFCRVIFLLHDSV